MQRNLIFIPVYNEEQHILSIIEAVRCFFGGDILVINDGSTDQSGSILESIKDPNLILTSHPKNEGYGASNIEAMKFAIEGKYSILVSLDCDWQHEPRYIPQFLCGMVNGPDVLSGSRYLDLQGPGTAPASRRAINQEITKIINSLNGYNLTDAFCGFKAYRVESLAKLALDEKGYAFPLQFWVQASHFGLTVKELAVPLLYPDLNRSFGALLDNPESRLNYYLSVINAEKERWKIP